MSAGGPLCDILTLIGKMQLEIVHLGGWCFFLVREVIAQGNCIGKAEMDAFLLGLASNTPSPLICLDLSGWMGLQRDADH